MHAANRHEYISVFVKPIQNVVGKLFLLLRITTVVSRFDEEACRRA
jgi:hypothetical protein